MGYLTSLAIHRPAARSLQSDLGDLHVCAAADGCAGGDGVGRRRGRAADPAAARADPDHAGDGDRGTDRLDAGDDGALGAGAGSCGRCSCRRTRRRAPRTWPGRSEPDRPHAKSDSSTPHGLQALGVDPKRIYVDHLVLTGEQVVGAEKSAEPFESAYLEHAKPKADVLRMPA